MVPEAIQRSLPARLRTLTLSRPLILALVLGGGLLLRLLLLGSKSIWLDEAYSIYQAQRPELAGLADVDPAHPPLYYSLLHYWIRWFGSSEGSVRLPSALVSTLNLGLLYLLARRLAGRRVALLAVALLAFSPLDIWYAQEARMYAFVVTAALLMAGGLAWGGAAGAAVLAVGLGGGLYLSYVSLPLWAALSAIWVVLWWVGGRPAAGLLVWAVGSLGGWLLYYPWWDNLWRVLEEGLRAAYVLYAVADVLQVEQYTVWHFGGGLLLAAAGVAVGVWLLRRLLQRPERRAVILALAVALFAGLTLLMAVPRLYSAKRLLVTGWPFVTLFVAWLLVNGRPQREWSRPGVAALLLLSLLVSLVSITQLPKDDWRAVVAYLEQGQGEGEVVWLDPPWNQFPYRYYRPGAAVHNGHTDRLRETAQTAEAIWLVAERQPGNPAPSSPSERWLDENMVLAEQVSFYNLELRRYVPGR